MFKEMPREAIQKYNKLLSQIDATAGRRDEIARKREQLITQRVGVEAAIRSIQQNPSAPGASRLMIYQEQKKDLDADIAEFAKQLEKVSADSRATRQLLDACRNFLREHGYRIPDIDERQYPSTWSEAQAR